MPRFADLPSPAAASGAPARGTPASKRGGSSIGDLAREFGVTHRALRFYESKGMLAPVRRGARRFYGADDRSRLATILRGKELGFTLREIRALLASEGLEAATPALAISSERVAEQLAHLRARKAEIERAIEALSAYDEAAAGKPDGGPR